jgi:outer membrane protein
MSRVGVCAVFLVIVGAGCAQQAALLTVPQTLLTSPAAVEQPHTKIPTDETEKIPRDEPVETLEQAWAAALAADRGLQARQWNESAAEQAAQSARAERWPVIGIDGSFTGRSNEPAFKVHFEGIPLPDEIIPYEQTENFAVRAKIDLPLYTSGRIEHGIAAAEAARTASALESDDAILDLKMRVAEVYVAVLRAQRDVDLTESTARSLESHAHDVEMRFHHEQVQQTDLLAAQVSLANARQAVIQAKNRLDGSRAAYNRHLGRPLTAAVSLAELPLTTPVSDVDELTALALHARPALARLTTHVEALRHRAKSERAKNAPQVTLRGEYDYEEDRFRVPEGIAAAGVGVSWNLFDGGRNRFEASNLLEQAEAIHCRRAELESLIALEVRQTWLDVQETRRRLETTPEAIEQAEENLRVVRKRYSVGAATNTEVLDAETLRTQAYRNHDNAMYDAVLAAWRLRHATGDLKGGYR